MIHHAPRKYRTFSGVVKVERHLPSVSNKNCGTPAMFGSSTPTIFGSTTLPMSGSSTFSFADKCSASFAFSTPTSTIPSISDSPPYTGNLKERRNEVLVTEWKIDNFLQGTSSFAVSPRFTFSDITWYLDLRTHGDANDCLSLHLCSVAMHGPCQIVEFGLGMMKPDGTPCFQHTFIRKYEKAVKYGIKCFAKKSVLIERKDQMTPSDSLTLVCKLKSIKSPGEKNTELYAGLLGMLSSKKHSDLSIHVKDEEFQVHKVILAASSKVFSAMFDHEMSENNSGVLNIQDCEPESFKDFLHFLYTGATHITDKNVYPLYFVGHKYSVESLISCCVGYMILHLSVDTVCDVATLGHRYSDDNITFACSEFFKRNVRKILMTPQWKLLMKDNYLVAFKLLEFIASSITINMTDP